MATFSRGLYSPINPDVEALENEPFRLTQGDAFEAAMDLNRMDTGVQQIGRLLEQRGLEQDTEEETKLSVEELKSRFPNTPFKEPTNLSVAKLLDRNNSVRRELEERVAAGPDNWKNKWGANMLAHAMDPLEFAAGAFVSYALPFIAPAGLAGKLGLNAGKHSMVQTAEGLVLQTVPKATVGQTVAREFVEGTIQNAMSIKLEHYTSQQEQRDMDVTATLVGAIGAAAGFSALHGAAKIGSSALTSFLGRVSRKHTEAIQNTALTQALEGKKINTDAVIDEMISDTNYPKKSFAKIADEEIPNTIFYSAKDTVTKDINSSSAVISDDYGAGIYLTDDIQIANGAAARKLSDNDGSIISGKIENANILDLDAPISQNNKAAYGFQSFIDAFTESKGKVNVREMTGKQIYETIQEGIESGEFHPSALDDINANLKKRGFDGIRGTADTLAGRPHAPHDFVMLFDSAKFKKEANLLPDADAVPRIPKVKAIEQMQKHQSHESSIHYDEPVFTEIKKIAEKTEEVVDLGAIRKKLDDVNEELKTAIEMNKDAAEYPELKALEKELLDEVKQYEAVNTVLKAAKKCWVG